MAPAPDCLNCRQNADLDALPLREHLLRTTYWRVAHAFDSALPGWLVVVPLEHVTALDELPTEAYAELGDLLGRLSAALRAVVGCAKTYFMQFSEADGFTHLHVHVVPRMPDQPDELKGPRVFGYLGAPVGGAVTEDDRDRLAGELRAALG